MTHSKNLLHLLWRGCLLLGSASATVGCESPRAAEGREKARALIEQLQQLDPAATKVARRQALGNLAALTLEDPDAVQLRDTCLRAHQGLLSAQTFQAKARAGLAEAARLADGAPAQAGRVGRAGKQERGAAVAQSEGSAPAAAAEPMPAASSPADIAAMEAAVALSQSELTLASAKTDLARCRELSGPFLRNHR